MVIENKCEAGYKLPGDMHDKCPKCGATRNEPCWEAIRRDQARLERADDLAEAVEVMLRQLETEDEEGLIGHVEPFQNAQAALSAYRAESAKGGA